MHLEAILIETRLAELDFQAVTPIQAQSIPVLLQGRDLMGQAGPDA
ncbi:hypothetical protein [Archangium sp.]|nr:hypothetical protein [Archangium sp.]HYO60099.1 hypothetical protein [Archangium sp.]